MVRDLLMVSFSSQAPITAISLSSFLGVSPIHKIYFYLLSGKTREQLFLHSKRRRCVAFYD